MSRIFVLVEGQTEEAVSLRISSFTNLRHYFFLLIRVLKNGWTKKGCRQVK